ncbi:FAD linked oxidase domain protein [Emticicia oligotrophica DSM 17448]|uniref:D-lactate dehydrogenase (cytochrome) n=1 Tax=Emticicia oligotrophica (strain DSM 17448 / CIP 109782 / MTCC 6937 / GPTSA100-15) TaxID=929562 RepID=A0ABM5MZX7_EMTOG|nr:FAD-linked oxidase C-terminal domain-containing protein [Emticicia oligotrophica]AFK02745.1 FAD linked oxidase domain protein [Emticicia oligotrophica DSM 17448]
MEKRFNQSVFEELKSLLQDRVTSETNIRNEHGVGFSYHACTPPDCVVFPLNTQEVSEIVKICARYSTPIIPFGAGTSVEGHILALEGGVCIDLSKMNQIIEISADDMYVTVESGVTRNQIDEALEGSGFCFPIGPGVNATLGGMASTRASGTNAVRYGTMKDNVLTLKAVLPNGEIIQTGSKAKKSSAGYDLTRLLIGAEGTLGIITELTLKLHSYPEAIYAAVCSFPSVELAVNTAIKTIQRGIPISKIELLDDAMMRAINLYSALGYAEKPTLFLEFAGSEIELKEQIKKVEEITQQHEVLEFLWETSEENRKKLWRARTDAAPASVALREGGKLMSTDVCVPISKLAKCIVDTQIDIKESNILAPILGHVGDGNFHLTIVVSADDADEFERAKALNERLVTRALEMGGTCTGEHGIGVGKLHYMKAEHGEALNLMWTIKKAIDPQNIMNPGKLLPKINH